MKWFNRKKPSGAPSDEYIHVEKVAEIVNVCRAICEGDFEARILSIPKEKGAERDLCHTVNEMIDRTDAYVRESTACLHFIDQNRYFRRISEDGMQGGFLNAAREINKAAEGVEEKMKFFGDLTGSLNEVSETFRVKASDMGTSASDTSEKSTSVAVAAEQALANVQTVAAAAEELAASTQEINHQVTQSTSMVAETAVKSEQISKVIGGLSEASSRIGDIVNLINDIASQTNLLALNATIEAARAGDAGKGFAVVANEVKALATQTAGATDDIRTQVGEIQGATSLAVDSIAEIGSSIKGLNEISSAIAAAVEQQGAATSEIARNIDQATQGVADISSSISDVSSNIGSVSTASGEVVDISSHLAEQAGTLRATLERKAS